MKALQKAVEVSFKRRCDGEAVGVSGNPVLAAVLVSTDQPVRPAHSYQLLLDLRKT